MISILIPTYNYNVFPLFEKINAQAKTLGIDYEIIVFDDHSSLPLPDNEKINSFPNASLIKLEQNIGRSAIRGKLAEQAKYNCLLFLDADVLPVTDRFLENYINVLDQATAPVIFGGIAYSPTKPSITERLRWEYGRNREVQSVSKRKKSPHFVIAQNLLVQKDCFLGLNTDVENYYGDDLVFSYGLMSNLYPVLHIDNPVFHLGLETSDLYLEKALTAVKSIVSLENNGRIAADFTKLQQGYLKLKKLGAVGIFQSAISPFKKRMKQNLLSATPNLLYFDLYRLAYYIDLKSEMHD